MTRAEKRRPLPRTEPLDEIYAQILPVVGCRKGCNDCCGAVPMGRIEAERVRHPLQPERGHAALPGEAQSAIASTPRSFCGGCAYSTPNGCAIYDQRPFICRLFGAVDGEPNLACPHGAHAERPLTRQQADVLGMKYIELVHGVRQS